MTNACRKQLDNLQRSQATHTGLLLSRYLTAHKSRKQTEEEKKKPTPEEDLLENATKIVAAKVYHEAFKRWKELVHQRGCQTFEATLSSSLAIGLGNENPLEVGLTLHHTYGMPIIPGSAIKGMCRRAVQHLPRRTRIDDEQFKVLFGDTNAASYFVFWDAWYNPDSAEDGQPFHRDVITVHHPKYYQKGSAWPTDFDDPTPVPFLVVKKGTRFLFSVTTPTPEWDGFVLELLKWSLQNLGIGGKTSSGYGFFSEIKPVEMKDEADRDALAAKLAQSNYTVSKRK